MKGKKGLEAVRASLDSIFSPEGLKNIQLLREGTLSTLPEESYSDRAVNQADKNTTVVTTEVFSDATSEVTTEGPTKVATEGESNTSVVTSVVPTVDTSVVPTVNATEVASEVATVAPGGRGGLTGNQTRVFDFLMTNNPCSMAHQDIAAALGMSRFSVRDIIYLFRDRGWLVMSKWRQGARSGVKVTMRVDRVPAAMVAPSVVTTVVPSVGTIIATTEVKKNHSFKIDRKDLNLSISQEDMTIHWPNLVRYGFGPGQIEHIRASLAKVGKSDDRVVQGLDHIEYELANGLLVDKDGNPVADPCSWAFRALAQNGYYRRPKGYVSPEEQAARDAEEEAKAVIAARQAAEQVQFEAWRGGLSEQELREAMKGHPGGNKDAWLKRVWKERREVLL